MVVGRRVRKVVGLAALAALAAGLAAVAPPSAPVGASPPNIAPGTAYRVTYLSSDVPGMAAVLDPLLVNTWGMTYRATSDLYMANDGTSTSALYRAGSGGTFGRHPTVPYLTIPGGLPTGVVANSTANFTISSGPTSGPANFIYASVTGNLVGWSGSVPVGSKAGITKASMPGHVWLGLAIGANGGGNRLYAADFANDHIDVFNGAWGSTTVSGGFTDATIPAGFAPYNIQNIGGALYVTYAKVGGDGRAQDGVGNGYVRKFNTDGVRDLTFAINNGALNSPWGLTIAPASFGIFGGALLVGNEGAGNPSIHAYNPTTGAFLGTLQDDGGDGIVIDKLHALQFGNGGNAGPTSTLHFTAGIGAEEHGLFGSMVPTPATATSIVGFTSANTVVSEATPSVTVNLLRDGSTASSATVQYATWGHSAPGFASQKNDYQLNIGTATFPAGVTTASFSILLVNDRYAEGNEVIELAISNPKGTQLGGITRSKITISDNDVVVPATNPIDESGFFVTQHYLDFFNRAPDAGGLAHWKKKLDDCGSDASCKAKTREQVSASFFLSSEFQNGMSLAYRSVKTGFGRAPLYGELMFANQVRRTGGSGGLYSFVTNHPEFQAATKALTNAQYVDKLVANSGGSFTAGEKSALVSALNGGTKTRTRVLGDIASDSSVQSAVFRPAFVFMQYAGYLRRDPETAGYNYWLNRLNSFNGDYDKAGMVRNFETSSEYRQRFGPS